MEEFENIIEKYRQELVELSKSSGSLQDDADAERDDPDFPLSGIGEAAQEDPPRGESPEEPEQSSPDAPQQALQPQMPGIEITAGVPFGSPNREKFETYDEFLKNNPQTGTLKIQVFASGQTYPVDNAKATVFLELKNGAREMFSGLTDTDGIIDSITLPAPDAAMSQRPSDSGFLPYAIYTTLIEHPGYVNAIYTNVPIFSGIESIQGVEMVPLASEGSGPEMPDMCTENQFQRLEGE